MQQTKVDRLIAARKRRKDAGGALSQLKLLMIFALVLLALVWPQLLPPNSFFIPNFAVVTVVLIVFNSKLHELMDSAFSSSEESFHYGFMQCMTCYTIMPIFGCVNCRRKGTLKLDLLSMIILCGNERCKAGYGERPCYDCGSIQGYEALYYHKKWNPLNGEVVSACYFDCPRCRQKGNRKLECCPGAMWKIAASPEDTHIECTKCHEPHYGVKCDRCSCLVIIDHCLVSINGKEVPIWPDAYQYFEVSPNDFTPSAKSTATRREGRDAPRLMKSDDFVPPSSVS